MRIAMTRVLPFVGSVAMLFIALSGLAAAEESAGEQRPIQSPSTATCPNALLRACCDVYCPKPQPCISSLHVVCGKDDYCRKPCPCVRCLGGCCATDSYCRKPCPNLCRPLVAEFFTCASCGDEYAGSTDCGRVTTSSTALPNFAEGHPKQGRRPLRLSGASPVELGTGIAK